MKAKTIVLTPTKKSVPATKKTATQQATVDKRTWRSFTTPSRSAHDSGKWQTRVEVLEDGSWQPRFVWYHDAPLTLLPALREQFSYYREHSAV